MDDKTAGLSIVSIILAVLLVISVANNFSSSDGSSLLGDNSKVQELQSEIYRLQGTINNLKSENQMLQGTVNSLQNENQMLQGTNQELRDITNLAKSQSIVTRYTINQQANRYSRWTVNASYAGYVFVSIDSSTTNLVYVRVSYTSNGGQSPHTIIYDQRSSSLSSGNSVCFPVLPGTVYVDVGNTNLVNGATHTVTIDYWY